MNFLAHAHLSGENDEILFGNFIADAVKGKQMEKYETDVQAGIRLHRQIDTFTDNHAVVRRSVNRVRSEYGRYSGVVMDIYYDHFLAKDWNQSTIKERKQEIKVIDKILKNLIRF